MSGPLFIPTTRSRSGGLAARREDSSSANPSTSMGDLTSDFSGRRGLVLDTEILPGEQCLIRAEVPLSEMGTYSSTLKSMTAGQGSFVMDYRRDAPAPPNVQAQVVASFTRKEEED